MLSLVAYLPSGSGRKGGIHPEVDLAQNEVVWVEIVKYVTSYKGYKGYSL